MKLLAVDIGNTNIVLSLMNESGEIEDTFRFVTKVERSCEEFESIFREFIGEIEIEDVIVSCVVPEVLVPFKEAIYKYLNKEVMLIDHTLDSGILIKTDRAEEVGADLIADAAAGYALYGGNILVADFGTATTFQYIDEEGAFLYCVILPGLEISAKALSSMASLLPDIELQVPNTILATNTIDCMCSGVMYGYIGSVEYIIKRFMSELKRDDIRVIATGGLGRLISQESTLIDVYDGDLMFKGMKIIYDRNK
ncbi:MAG: type III pantothenate kinase [Erysipelotrichales bacterium]|nr:type III pantothenate kinase [Erysipelotrichales bacterium]